MLDCMTNILGPLPHFFWLVEYTMGLVCKKDFLCIRSSKILFFYIEKQVLKRPDPNYFFLHVLLSLVYLYSIQHNFVSPAEEKIDLRLP